MLVKGTIDTRITIKPYDRYYRLYFGEGSLIPFLRIAYSEELSLVLSFTHSITWRLKQHSHIRELSAYNVYVVLKHIIFFIINRKLLYIVIIFAQFKSPPPRQHQVIVDRHMLKRDSDLNYIIWVIKKFMCYLLATEFGHEASELFFSKCQPNDCLFGLYTSLNVYSLFKSYVACSSIHTANLLARHRYCTAKTIIT